MCCLEESVRYNSVQRGVLKFMDFVECRWSKYLHVDSCYSSKGCLIVYNVNVFKEKSERI